MLSLQRQLYVKPNFFKKKDKKVNSLLLSIVKCTQRNMWIHHFFFSCTFNCKFMEAPLQFLRFLFIYLVFWGRHWSSSQKWNSENIPVIELLLFSSKEILLIEITVIKPIQCRRSTNQVIIDAELDLDWFVSELCWEMMPSTPDNHNM